MDRRIDWRALYRPAAQRLALDLVSIACCLTSTTISRPLMVMGLNFPTPLGIAAGFDRNGRLARRVGALGFGFNEIGSLTASEVCQLKPVLQGKSRLGINLTLDAKSSTADICEQLRSAWPHGDYLVLNLIGPASAPFLQQTARLRNLLSTLRKELDQLNLTGGRRVPLVAKLRCLPGQIPFSLTGLLLDVELDGLLAAHDPGPPATRERYRAWQDQQQQRLACEQIEHLRRFCGEDMALMSVGGIQTAGHLQARMNAGAELVQVHAALLRQGPWLAHRLLR